MAINPASAKSHQNYCEKKGYQFPILSDPERQVQADWQTLKPDGKKVQRSVYAIDPKGKVIYAAMGQGDFGEILALVGGAK